MPYLWALAGVGMGGYFLTGSCFPSQSSACALAPCALSALVLSCYLCLFFSEDTACQEQAQQISGCLTNLAGTSVRIVGEGDIYVLFQSSIVRPAKATASRQLYRQPCPSAVSDKLRIQELVYFCHQGNLLLALSWVSSAAKAVTQSKSFNSGQLS